MAILVGAILGGMSIGAGLKAQQNKIKAEQSATAFASANQANTNANENTNANANANPNPNPNLSTATDNTGLRVLGASTTAEQVAKQETLEKITPDSLNILVDKDHGLPKNYKPADLISLKGLGIKVSGGNFQLRREAAQALKTLTAAMKKQKLDVVVISGFRTYSQQVATYNQVAQAQGDAKADVTSAPPGHSEHQLGTTVDLSLVAKGGKLASIYPNRPSAAWKWLDQNAHQYGFVMSYRSGQTAATGYRFEPWHWRYVGVPLATEIRQSAQNPQNFYKPLN